MNLRRFFKLKPRRLINCLEELEWLKQHDPFRGDFDVAIIHIGMGYSIKIIRNTSYHTSMYEAWLKCRGMLICGTSTMSSVRFFDYDSEVVKFVNWAYNYARKNF